MPDTVTVLLEVGDERARQEKLCAAGKFKWTCAAAWVDGEYAYASLKANGLKLGVLLEEVGEVAREINEAIPNGAISDERRTKLREELIQVAAVAVAWAEAL